jgi:hypothetical protein
MMTQPPLSPAAITAAPSTPAAAPSSPSTIARSGVTWRGLLVGGVGVPVTCFVVAWAEIKLMTLQIGYLQMPPAVIGLLLVLLLLNAGLRAVSKRAALTPQDLLVAYSMMVVASMISSRGLMQKVLPVLVTPNYFTDIGGPFKPYLRQYLFAFDVNGADKQDVAQRYFEGLRVGEPIPWELWIGPVLLWTVLALLVFGAFLFLAALLRRQWVDAEKLSFALVQLPLELNGAGDTREGPLFRNKLMWTGFALPMVVFLLKGLHTWYPSVPDVSLEIDVNALVAQSPPWNGIYYTLLRFSFALVGFMFLLPSELVFSLWFFFVLSRVQDVAARSFNMDMPGMPLYPCPLYRGYQAMGAYLVLAVYLLRVARPHLSQVWRAVTGEPHEDDSAEMFRYRTAFWGFWACVAGTGVYLVVIFGMSPLLAAMQLFGLFFVIALVMARSTAEAGMLMTESSFRPIDVLRLFTPLHTLGPQNLTALALSDTVLMRDQRALVLSTFLDGLRITDGARVRRQSFAGIFALAVLLSVAFAAYIQLRLPYRYGGITLYSYVYNANNKWGFEDYKQYLQPGALPLGWQGPTFLIVGLVVTTLLVWGRATLGWFPFHPLGYALCSSWTMIVFWFSAFVAWAFKSLILRYGGMKLYRQARPLFLGMILGEFTAALIWTIANAILDTPVPAFPWA